MTTEPVLAIIYGTMGVAYLGHGAWVLVTEQVPKRYPLLALNMRSPVAAAVVEIFGGVGVLVGDAGQILSSTPMTATALGLIFLGLALGMLKERRARQQAKAVPVVPATDARPMGYL